MDNKFGLRAQIRGPGSDPEGISARELADILLRLEKAISIATGGHHAGVLDEHPEPPISLVELHKGKSTDLAFICPDFSQPGVIAITEAISTKDYSRIPELAHREIAHISRFIVAKGWSFEFQENSDKNIHKAVISADNQVSEPPIAFVDGPTTLFGYLLRIGGRRARAKVQIIDSQQLNISVSKRLAKDLAVRLYENIGIIGIATWRTSDWRIVSFDGKELTEYRPQKNDLTKGFKELSKASGKRFDSVDASEYVRKLREEE